MTMNMRYTMTMLLLAYSCVDVMLDIQMDMIVRMSQEKILT